MDAQISEVASILRSCLITSKNGCPIDQLNREYKMLEGRYIPYQKLGFQTLDAFMKVVPDIRMIRRGIDLWVEAIPTKASAHISRLVANQNRPKSRRRKTRNIYQIPVRRSQPLPLHRGLSYAKPNGQTNRVTSKPQTPTSPPTVTVYPPKVLMQQSVIASPRVDPSNDSSTRLRASTTDAASTLSKHPDCEKKNRAAMTVPPVTVYTPKKTKPLESLRMPMRPQQAAAMTPTSPMTPLTPITPTIPKSPRTPFSFPPFPLSPPMSPRSPLLPLPLTFSNPTAGGGDCPEDPRELLDRLVRRLKLPAPEYKIQRQKNGIRGRVYGQVCIGPREYISYPEEAKNETEAEILAARQALKDFQKEIDRKLGLQWTTDIPLMKQRILKIVDQHNGVFTHKIPAYYEEQYNETLPKYWTKEIEKWTEVTIDTGVNEARILRRRVSFTETDKVPKLPSPTIDKEVVLTPMGPSKPAPFELLEEDKWLASVTLVNSWDEIWIHRFGETCNDEFDKMTESMVKHYESVEYPIFEVVEIGEYYVLPEDEDYNRVRVIDYDPMTYEATVLFIDSGEEDHVSASKLLPLEKIFCWPCAQAIKVSLAGLEEFADCPIAIDSAMPQIEELLCRDILSVEVVSCDIQDDVTVASVIFYDTKQSDCVLNEIIGEMVSNELVTTVPKLEGERAITEINISHVETNGDVFVQVNHEGMKYLVNAQNELMSRGLLEEDIDRSMVKSVDRTTVYFVKCSKTGSWFRARVIGGTETPLYEVFLIDYGRTINVFADNVLQLEILSKTLAELPAQAIKVRLHDIEPSSMDDKMIAKLNKLAPPSQILLLKVVTTGHPHSAPTVNLFKRHETDDVLVHINVALALDELFKSADYGNINVCRPKKRIDRVNSRPNGEHDTGKTLQPPRISDVGASFLVHVTMAASPSNFTVQPYKNRAALAAMMSELQEVCSSYTGPHPSSKSIRADQFYAAQNVKGIWHRAIISHIMNDHMVIVHFCDYGDASVITLDKLQPLAKQFFKLPYQAIKARLVGIQPNNIQWSPEDCVRFNELIVGRDLVSVVTEWAPKKHSPGNTALGLKLIDESSSERIYIDKLLVDEGRAKHTD